MNLKKTSTVIYLFILYSSVLAAQGGGPPPPGLPDDTPPFPIDGQSFVLVIAGIILGFIVTLKRRKSH